jgi:hypothetical protein
MRISPSYVLLASAVVTAGAADSSSVTGNWNVHNSIAGNESDMACSFIQKDKELTGTCQADQGTVKISGTIDDKKVSWTYKSEHDGSPITLTYGGTLDSSDKISGTVKVEEYGVDGEFTATADKRMASSTFGGR